MKGETGELLLTEQDGQLGLAPAGIALAQGQDAIGEAGRPSGPATAMRAVRAFFQGR